MSTARYCCANCIDDLHLRRQLIPALSKVIGTCSYCGSDNQPLVAPIELREQFELVIGVYTPDATGKTLVEWLKEDWAMFSHVCMDLAHAKELLADILDDGDIVRALFTASLQSKSEALVHWEQLRTELMHTNRFFPTTVIDLRRLERLLPFLLLDEEDTPKTWYRARIQSSVDVFSVAEMGSPPKHLASHGRANPAGIPYLYLASQDITAISEVRPHAGDNVSVAKFTVPDGLKIVDLRHPRRTVSPFILPDENEVALLRGDIEFLERLGEELTRPILQKSAAFDYIPSQYLCEFAKKCGFNGVMYRSSVDGGVNVALFEPGQATVVDVVSHHILRVVVEI
jgi:RES domain-containing protein